jgi:hypothetical protein
MAGGPHWALAIGNSPRERGRLSLASISCFRLRMQLKEIEGSNLGTEFLINYIISVFWQKCSFGSFSGNMDVVFAKIMRTKKIWEKSKTRSFIEYKIKSSVRKGFLSCRVNESPN